MKILHTSDWHLGISDNERSLLEDQRFFIGEICRIIEERKVEAVLIAGDVYDNPLSNADANSLFSSTIAKIRKELGASVFVIAGNHDGADRIAVYREIVAQSGLYIQGRLERDVSPVVLGDTEIFMLPWITEEKVKTLFPEEKERISCLEDAYMVVTDRMREQFSPDRKHVIVSHAYVTGSETSTSDRAAEIGNAERISASVFEGFDYAALGHIHKPQKITDTVRYSGTPMPYSFGKEETQAKQVLLIDTDTMEIDEIKLGLLHRRTTFKGTLEELLNPQCSEEERTGYTRLVMTDGYLSSDKYQLLRTVYPLVLEASGTVFNDEGGRNSMTLQEYEALETDPAEVFRRFHRDVFSTEADERRVSAFERIAREIEEESEE